MAANTGTRLLLWIAGIGLFIAALTAIAVALLTEPGALPAVGAEGRWLELRLSGALADGPEEGRYSLDPENAPLYVTDIASTIREAADDPSIQGLYLLLRSPSLGLAGAQEIRGALADFTAAGKPCVAWSKTYENATWYLATACPEIHLHPEGVPAVLGLQLETTYYAGALEKLGIRAEYVRAGAYKSAVESYLQAGPSEEAREMYEALIESLYAHFIGDAARGWAAPAEAALAAAEGDLEALRALGLAGTRQAPLALAEAGRGWVSRWSEEQARGLIDDPPVTARSALARGLVDALSFRDELEARIDESAERERLRSYMADRRGGFGRSGPQVAVVHLQGSIIDGRSGGGFTGASIGDRTGVGYLDELREDDDVAAVVLRVDSPGGSALASDVIWRAVRRTAEVKPVVASMAGYAASGGYYVAMAPDHIVAAPSTLTGSIGVYGGKLALGGLFEKLGVSTWRVQRGAMAGLFSSTSPLTSAERAKLQERVDDFYRAFVTKAAQSRGVDVESMDAVAQGRVWTGAQAARRGLVDELGGLDLAIERAAERAGLAPGYGLTVLPRESTFIEAMLEAVEPPEERAEAAAALEAALGEELAAALARARQLEALFEGGGLAAAPLHLPRIR